MKINNTETPKEDNYMPGDYNPKLKLSIKDIKGATVTPTLDNWGRGTRTQTDLIISGWRWFDRSAMILDIFDNPNRDIKK